MQPRLNPSLALILGGTGAVGSAVLRGLAKRNVPTLFTYFRSTEKARALSAEYSQESRKVDLGESNSIKELFSELDRRSVVPEIVIHCATVSSNKPLAETSDEEWDQIQRVNARSAFIVCRELARRLKPSKEVHLVLISALDRVQSLPLPIAFAASQGALSSMVMAMSKELGAIGLRINLLALGPLESGLSQSLDPKLMDDFRNFSALRRLGTPEEAANAALWLALDNSYMNGKVLTVNGGI